MGLFRRIGQLFSSSQDSKTVPKKVLLRELLNNARRAQYAENYDEALAHLDEAYAIAESEKNTRTQIDINLSRGDILIAKEDYDTARFVLTDLRDDSEARELNAPLAYALCSLGVLEQRDNNLTEAQSLFEKARDVADSIHTDGASGRASAHLGDIYLIQGNTSYAVYLLEDAVTKLDRSGDRELLGYFLGRLGIAQIDLGQTAQGEVHLQRGLDLATNIKHHPQMRLLNALVAENELKQGNYRRALAYFEDALKFYPDPRPQTGDYAKLLCHMSQASFHIGDSFNALKYAEDALSITQHVDNPELKAMAKALIALTKGAQSETDAVSHLEQASSLYDTLEPTSFSIDILRKLADVQLETGQDERALETYQRALSRAKDLPADAATVYSELASYYYQKRQMRDALDALQKALPLFEDTHQTGQVAGVHCDMGLMYDQLGDGKLAQREHGTALEMLSRVNDTPQRGIILANVAAAYSSYGDIESAQDFFNESITIAQHTKNTSAEITRRTNYGRLLAITNRPQEALTELIAVHTLSEKHDLSLQRGLILSNIGLAYAALDQHDKAVEYYQQALEQLNSIGDMASVWTGRLYANWGDLALTIDDAETAKSSYDQANALSQEASIVDVLIQVVIGRSRLAIRAGDLAQAETDLNKITSVAKRQDYQQLLAILHQAWSELYAQQGKTETAQQSWETAQRIREIMRMKPISADWL